MSERPSESASGAAASEVRVKPPWWLITSWTRWAWFGLLYPGLMSFLALQRRGEGRGSTIDVFLVVLFIACVTFAVVQLVLTLRAYGREPDLRTREWPSPAPGSGVSRRVWIWIMIIAIAAVSLVLLVYAGWPGALFVAAISAGLVVLYVRFDLFADDRPPAQQNARSDQTDQPGEPPDR